MLNEPGIKVSVKQMVVVGSYAGQPLTRAEFTYQPPPGKVFVMFTLGIATEEEAKKLNPKELLEQMGWEFKGEKS